MQSLKTDFIKIWQTERGIIAMMILNLLLSIGLLVFTALSLNPEAAVVKISYSDISGYRSGAWLYFATFLILSVVFGVFHNLLSVLVYHKRGSGMTKFFLITTTFLILGAVLVLVRLLGEG
jgi:hypothetical protein